MSNQHFSAHDDEMATMPSKKLPIAIVGVVLVLFVAGLFSIAYYQPKSQPQPDAVSNDFFPNGTEGTTVSETPEAEKTPERTYTAPTQAEIDAAKTKGTRQATIKTSKGDMVVELYGADAPLHVANFVKLAQADFYDGLTFHRVEPNFVIQGGDPNGNGTGGPGYEIALEISPKLRHVEGALAMARSAHPNSAGSQFYITLAQTDGLDDNYSVFGKVIKGLEVSKKIKIGDDIIDVVVQ